MAQDYKAPENSIRPTLYIGLGGVGSRIVDRIGGESRNAAELGESTSFIDPVCYHRYQ